MNEEDKILYDEDAVKYLGEHVVIPEGYTAIASGAFARYYGSENEIKTIQFSDSLKAICDDAFYGNSNLETIKIPKNLTYIEPRAFRHCGSLIEYKVDSNNPAYSDIDGVLYSKEKTELLVYPAGKKDEIFSVPDGVTDIGEYAFDMCANLIHINLPGSVRNILGSFSLSFGRKIKTINVAADNPVYTDVDGVLFNKDKSLLIRCPEGADFSVYTVPDSVTAIHDWAFSSCKNLTGIILPEGLKTIGRIAFSGCSNLEDINLPESITDIKRSAFSHCRKLTHITIPPKITVLKSWVLDGCSGLVSINLPDGLLKINEGALSSCPELTAITIPVGVTDIIGWQFNNCHKLEAINVAKGNLSFVDVDGVLFSKDKKTLVRCPPAYKEKNFSVPDGVEVIGYRAFSDCKFENIHLSKSVKMIEGDGIAFFLNNYSQKDINDYHNKVEKEREDDE
jgi:hypothetical protein